MTSAHLQRALLLLEQSRTEQAEDELRRALADDPHSPLAHALLARCLVVRKQYHEASAEADLAVHLAPDHAFTHYTRAAVLYARNRFPAAKSAAEEAIRLDPENADYWAMLSSIEWIRRQWQPALDAAGQGLAIDAEHVDCNNLRAMALVKLGRRDLAGQTIDAALARDPDNADSHANRGWTLLEEGRHREALEHFREALRLEPHHGWARSGIVEALKAKNIIYRLMLAYFLWMSKLSAGAQWGIIIGGYLGYRALDALAAGRPALAVFAWPVLFAYITFAVMTWIADPLFNLLLRMSRFGRYALTREQIVASNWLGGTLAVSVMLAVAALVTNRGALLILSLVTAIMIIPLAAVFRCEAGWPRRVMILLAAATYASGLSLVVKGEFAEQMAPAVAGRLANFAGMWIYLLIACQIGGNLLAGVRARR